MAKRPNPFFGQWETSETLANQTRHSKLGLFSGKRLPRLIFPACPHRHLSNQGLGFSKSHSIKILLTMST
jgi:hypothetical protein